MSKIHPKEETYPLQRRFSGAKIVIFFQIHKNIVEIFIFFSSVFEFIETFRYGSLKTQSFLYTTVRYKKTPAALAAGAIYRTAGERLFPELLVEDNAEFLRIEINHCFLRSCELVHGL